MQPTTQHQQQPTATVSSKQQRAKTMLSELKPVNQPAANKTRCIKTSTRKGMEVAASETGCRN